MKTLFGIALGLLVGFFMSLKNTPEAEKKHPRNDCYTRLENWQNDGRWVVKLKNGYIIRPYRIRLDTCFHPPLVTPELYELMPFEIDTMFLVPDSLGGDTLPDWDNMPR